MDFIYIQYRMFCYSPDRREERALYPPVFKDREYRRKMVCVSVVESEQGCVFRKRNIILIGGDACSIVTSR